MKKYQFILPICLYLILINGISEGKPFEKDSTEVDSKIKNYPGGTRIFMTSDGKKILLTPQGKRKILDYDVTVQGRPEIGIENPYSIAKIIQKQDGTTILERHDGTKIVKTADGSTFEYQPKHEE